MSSATGIFLLSLTAIPIAYSLNFAYQLSWGQWPVLFIGCVCLFAVALVAYVLVKSSSSRHRISDPCFYVFSVFAFTSVIDMVIALELDGVIDNFVTFYLKEGELYLNTAHGTMINYWDGTGQYCMYLMMVTAIVWKQSYREVALYWFGSIMMSLVIFMPGNIAGKFGGDLKVSYVLNFPFVVLPFVILVKKERRAK
ncbi:putative transmembrane 6 superfamily member 1 isoform X2 [Apostichopus japonicus]|uniref:Putative transmembrane 6 superfamily member 1 isoform X2 n=1 Tax=Stichopus japonicus TaxID=307972 RepID=A0A2G8LM88_STIJA|nr:putative transmembrane 6 superfamily member 1 isoform X2 [Apostichopus japonicus]